jgi:hypothetical protein
MTTTNGAFIVPVLYDLLQHNAKPTYKPSLNVFSKILLKVMAVS